MATNLFAEKRFNFCTFQQLMKTLLIFLLALPLLTFSQESLGTILIKTSPLEVDQLVSIDSYGAIYYTKNSTLYKKTSEQELNYSNFQLNSISYVNTFNPLKLAVFYKQFNTVVILDNRLSEIFRVDFNALQPYRNVSFITSGYDNSLWIFNSDVNQLELFDFKTAKSRFSTIPVTSQVLNLVSNYNFCWLLTEKFLYKYNYFGSLVSKMPNNGFTQLRQFGENIILQKENSLFLQKENENQTIEIQLPDLLIKQFFVTNETLYLYDLQKVYEFKLTIN